MSQQNPSKFEVHACVKHSQLHFLHHCGKINHAFVLRVLLSLNECKSKATICICNFTDSRFYLSSDLHPGLLGIIYCLPFSKSNCFLSSFRIQNMYLNPSNKTVVGNQTNGLKLIFFFKKMHAIGGG